MDLNNIAKEISYMDFSDVPADNTDEAIFNLATDLYDLNENEANKIINIIMKKYIQNIK